MVAFAACLAACGGPRTPPLPKTFDVPLYVENAQSSPPAGNALIVLDTSQSMRSYFGSDRRHRRTVIQLYLAEHLLNDMSAFGGVREPMMSSIGGEFSVPKPIASLREYALPDTDFERNRTFDGGSTRLADVFEKVDPAEYDLLVLVTDGTQSVTFRNVASTEGAAASCVRGNDYGCLIDAVDRRVLGEGRGLWLVAFRSELVGPIPSERLDVNGHHVVVDPPPGTRVFRPAYIWVVANHPDAGRRFVNQVVVDLQDSANRLATVDPDVESEIHAVEFAPMPECRFRATRHSGFKLAAGEWPLITKQLEAPEPRTLRHRLICVNRKGEKYTPVAGTFGFNGESAFPNVQNLFRELETELAFDKQEQDVVALVDRESRILLKVDCSRVPDRGGGADPPFATKAIFHARPSASPEVWWRQWSTDDDTRPENLGRTLYLDRVVEALGQAGLNARCPSVNYALEVE
ncbi:MAG: hypothetical protein IT350_07950 [Deltaproteobacteria bacterium]|nr:hypothetical protein [Deltaproteobacteria bacterium]